MDGRVSVVGSGRLDGRGECRSGRQSRVALLRTHGLASVTLLRDLFRHAGLADAISGMRRGAMSTYLIVLLRGQGSIEIEADFYSQDGDEFVFTERGKEVRRVPKLDIASISKAPSPPRV
jgi:hypothetical protein